MKKIVENSKELKASTEFQVKADGCDIFCGRSRVYNWRNPLTSDTLDSDTSEVKLAEHVKFNYAGFAHVACEKEVEIEIICKSPLDKEPLLRPLSYGIKAVQNGATVNFKVKPGQKVSFEPYGDTGPVLHLFADLPENDVPDPDDPDVLYFGPGIHERDRIELKDNQTLYLAPGAVLKAVISENEPFERLEPRGRLTLRHLYHFISAWDVKNIKICGRGIIDTSEIANAYARKNPISLNRCENVEISGITILDATCWTITLYRCSNCLVENIKQISAFYNSDGVNTVSSRDVVVRDCFLRNRDDGIAIKAMDTGNTDCFLEEPDEELPGGEVENVLVENCVIWSDWGYAFGATYEIRKPVRNITIRNCDVIHATHPGRQGVIGILVSDKDHVSDILFENIRVERTLKPLVDMRILITPWTVDPDLGTIHDITFRNIELYELPPASVMEDCERTEQYIQNYSHFLECSLNLFHLEGYSEKSHIKNITFDNIVVKGDQIHNVSQLEILPFVENIMIR